MKIGYVRVSKGSQNFDLQVDAILKYGVKPENIYKDISSGAKSDRPELERCLKSLQNGDVLVVWKLDRLGRSLKHLVNVVEDLNNRGILFKALSGTDSAIDTTTSIGKFIFGVFAAMAEFERNMIKERVMAGLSAARARGRIGGAPYKMTPAKLKLAQAAMKNRSTSVSKLCKELGISRQTLYRFVDPNGNIRADGKKLLESQDKQ